MWRTIAALGSIPPALLMVAGGLVPVISGASGVDAASTISGAVAMGLSGTAGMAAAASVLVAGVLGPRPDGVPRLGVWTWWLLAVTGLCTCGGMALVMAVAIVPT